MYLGIRAVIAKSIERIHKANLINFCIVPIEFSDPADYDKIESDDELTIEGLTDAINISDQITIKEKSGKYEFIGKLDLSERDRKILLSAGLLNTLKGSKCPRKP
jgi:aconitate hydratase